MWKTLQSTEYNILVNDTVTINCLRAYRILTSLNKYLLVRTSAALHRSSGPPPHIFLCRLPLPLQRGLFDSAAHCTAPHFVVRRHHPARSAPAFACNWSSVEDLSGRLRPSHKVNPGPTRWPDSLMQDIFEPPKSELLSHLISRNFATRILRSIPNSSCQAAAHPEKKGSWPIF